MSRATIDGIREFIEMYDKQDVLTVRECNTVQPADRYVLGQIAVDGYQVSWKKGEDDYHIYVCRNITAAAECVNDIVFDLPMNVTPAQ